jgi:hypothetical protein
MHQPLWLVEAAALFLVVGVAFWRGRPSERWMAAAFLAASLLSPLVESRTAYHGINLPILVVDSLFALSFILLTLRYAHLWMVAAAGASVFQLVIHGGMMMRGDIPIHAYYVGLEIASDLGVIALGVGDFAALRSRTR